MKVFANYSVLCLQARIHNNRTVSITNRPQTATINVNVAPFSAEPNVSLLRFFISFFVCKIFLPNEPFITSHLGTNVKLAVAAAVAANIDVTAINSSSSSL